MPGVFRGLLADLGGDICLTLKKEAAKSPRYSLVRNYQARSRP
jgi:hypothetical protein